MQDNYIFWEGIYPALAIRIASKTKPLAEWYAISPVNSLIVRVIKKSIKKYKVKLLLCDQKQTRDSISDFKIFLTGISPASLSSWSVLLCVCVRVCVCVCF